MSEDKEEFSCKHLESRHAIFCLYGVDSQGSGYVNPPKGFATHKVWSGWARGWVCNRDATCPEQEEVK